MSDDGATIYGATLSGEGIYKSSSLQDVLTSNTWVGPQSGTGTIAWKSIASDAIGMNLVAGSSGAGRLFSNDVITQARNIRTAIYFMIAKVSVYNLVKWR